MGVNLTIPLNVVIYFRQFADVAKLNIPYFGVLIDRIFTTTGPYSKNFEQIGYESLHSIRNFGF
jgi:hypothetical protein